MEFLEDYQVYINGYDQASVLVGNAQKAQSSSKNNFAYLGEFISKQLKTTKFGFASVSSFLIAPVQRLPRYMLFLKDLLNCTPEDHPDYPHVHDSFHTLDTFLFFYFIFLFIYSFIFILFYFIYLFDFLYLIF